MGRHRSGSGERSWVRAPWCSSVVLATGSALHTWNGRSG